MLNREIGKHQLIHKQSIAYLGPVGTYSYFAAKEMFKDVDVQAELGGNYEKAEYIAMPSIFDVFEKVKKAEVNLGIVPVENSIEGIVKDSMNLFADAPVIVLKQLALEIDHCLLSTAAHIDDIKIVKAHPQALGQCKIWLSKNVPGATLVPATSNVTTSTTAHEAIIASKKAASLYNLNVLAEHISDIKDNKTLFYLITQNSNQFFRKETLSKDVDMSVQEKGVATVIFLLETEDKVGILRDILTVFAEHSLNLTRIHSLPTGELGRYYFVLDVSVSQDANIMKPIYSRLETLCKSVRVLGTV